MFKSINIVYLLLLIIILLYFIVRKNKKETFKNNKKLLFIHIPKTGGTYIEKTLKKNGYNVGTYSNLNKSKNNCSHWHTPPKYNKNINFKDYITFTVVRNPYTRFISEYNWGSFGHHYKYLNTKCDINTFATNLKDPNKIIYDGDCHLLKQEEYLIDYYGNKIENILYQETLNDDLKKFINKYNLNIKNINNKKLQVKKNNKNINNLNNSSKNILKKYYENDFKILNYKC